MDIPSPLLNIDLPARPDSLTKLGFLLAEEDINLQAIGSLIEHDMPLAAAVMKAVSSPIYGLKGRVQTVQQAVTYLGIREIAALTYEIGLRSSFPSMPEMNAIWERAALRGLLMGRLAQALSMDAWSAHTAGLFEECGKAILLKHAPKVYPDLLKQAPDDLALVELETQRFQISHDLLAAKMCQQWGLSQAAVSSVQHHVHVQQTRQLPRSAGRSICVLSGLVYALMHAPDTLEDVIQALAPQAMLDQTLLIKGAQKVKDKIDNALAHT